MLNQLLAARKSVRGYQAREVPHEVLKDIFANAQRAPSWCNTQPWHIWLFSGAKRLELVTALQSAATTSMPTPEIAWPGEYPEPYNTRRKECGKALYGAMGIARDDKEARLKAWMDNFAAFGAPHIAIVAVPKSLLPYALIDLGVWLQTVMLLAQEQGVASCAQASLTSYPAAIRKTISVHDELALAVGIALGFEDTSIAANRCRTEREPLASNLTWSD